MANTYAEIIDAIAVINANIPGVSAAYTSTNLPTTLTVFPCAFTLLGPDDYSKFGLTEYWVRVFIAPVINSNPSIAYANCLDMSQAFKDTYKAIFKVGTCYLLGNRLTMKTGFGSTGFAYTMKWGPAEYYGFQLNLPLGNSEGS